MSSQNRGSNTSQISNSISTALFNSGLTIPASDIYHSNSSEGLLKSDNLEENPKLLNYDGTNSNSNNSTDFKILPQIKEIQDFRREKQKDHESYNSSNEKERDTIFKNNRYSMIQQNDCLIKSKQQFDKQNCMNDFPKFSKSEKAQQCETSLSDSLNLLEKEIFTEINDALQSIHMSNADQELILGGFNMFLQIKEGQMIQKKSIMIQQGKNGKYLLKTISENNIVYEVEREYDDFKNLNEYFQNSENYFGVMKPCLSISPEPKNLKSYLEEYFKNGIFQYDEILLNFLQIKDDYHQTQTPKFTYQQWVQKQLKYLDEEEIKCISALLEEIDKNENETKNDIEIQKISQIKQEVNDFIKELNASKDKDDKFKKQKIKNLVQIYDQTQFSIFSSQLLQKKLFLKKTLNEQLNISTRNNIIKDSLQQQNKIISSLEEKLSLQLQFIQQLISKRFQELKKESN